MQNISKTPFLFVIFLLGLTACEEPDRDLAVTPTDPTHRLIRQGSVEGVVQENGSYAWLGIPYARPPVGELRWRPPQAPERFSSRFVADDNSQLCPQFVSPLSAGVADEDGDGIVGDEDCLYLNVYAPGNTSSSDRLPVMVWIYGGGNNSGYAGDYNGGNLAESQKVIVVTFNYRLGSLGWFIHPAILPEGASGADASGNWSTLDTIHALKWVQNNIESFGGDPSNVTIFGESAGGANVLSLVTSPLASGLFHKAVVQSGGIDTIPLEQGINFSDDETPGHTHSSREIINKILIRDGRAANREEAKALQLSMSDGEIRELLYSQNAAEFLQLFNRDQSRNYPAPKKFRDGHVFPDMPPLEQLASGEYNQVPIILGTNRDERRIYMYQDPRWQPLLKTDPAEYVRVAKYPSDVWKLMGVDRLARIMSDVQDAPVFAYRFDWDEENTWQGVDLSLAIGAGHSVEMAFVFGDWDIGFVPKQIMYDPARNESRNALANSMMSYWANFAYTGAPASGRSGKEVPWLPWQQGEDQPKMLILDTEQDGGIRMSSDSVTLDSIKAEFLADEFSNAANRCYVYRAAFERVGGFDSEEYAGLGCPAIKSISP